MFGNNGDSPFSVLFVLGDSLSDSGGINALVTPGDPDSYLGDFGYGHARFNRQDTDGDGEDESASYAVDAVTEFDLAEEVENFAIAGAEALRSRTLETILQDGRGYPEGPTLYETLDSLDQLPPENNLATVIDAGAQRERILERYVELGRPENAAALINIGSNDFGALTVRFAEETSDIPTPEELAIIEAAIAQTIAGVTATIVETAATFAGAGIETIVVANLFTSYTPLVQLDPEPDPTLNLATYADLAIETQNAALTAELGQLEAEVDAEIEIVDFKGLFDEIFDDPSSFNLLNLIQPVYLSLPFGKPGEPGEFTIAENPNFPDDVALDQTAFWDIVHPTVAAHDIQAAFLDASLQDDLSFLTADADTYLPDLFGQRDDVVFGGGGADTIEAGAGDDVLFGGTDHDRINGGIGNDLLVGGSGDDVLLGGGLLSWFVADDFDVLAGGDGDDRLWGGRRADFLSDGLGNDVVRGQGGHDTLVHVDEPELGGGAGDVDIFDGGWGDDTLLLFVADDAAREAAKQAVTHAAEAGSLSDFEIEELGLTVTNVERVVIFDERRLPLDLDLPAPLAENVAEADMWNAIPLSADGPFSLADAVLDTDTLLLA